MHNLCMVKKTYYSLVFGNIFNDLTILNILPHIHEPRYLTYFQDINDVVYYNLS